MSVPLFVAFTIVSISSMFSNNAFMNSHEYFYYKLRNVSNDEGGNGTSTDVTPMQAEFEAYLMVVGGIACVFGSIVNAFATKRLSNTFRVIAGHVLVLVVFLPTIALTYVDSDDDQEKFFAISLAMFAVACFGSLGMMAGGVLGLSATFPAKYTQAVMIGQPLAGVLASFLSIVCQAGTSDVIINGRVYFCICFLLTIVSIFVYLYLAKSQPPAEDYRPMYDEETGETIDSSSSEVEVPAADELGERDLTIAQQTVEVVRVSGPDLFAVAIILIVTLSAYPGMSSLVRSTSRSRTWNAYFSSVVSFFLYNIGDMIGRSIANSMSMNRKALLTVSCLRVLLIPLLAECNVQPRVHTESMLPYDGVFILLVFLLSFSHGFCITNATLSATKRAHANLRELTGSILNVVGVTSALGGSVFGILALKLI